MSPVWGPDGRELFYVDYRGIYRVEVSTYGNFAHAKPSLLFTGNFVLQTPDFTNFDISTDGSCFALIQPGESDAAPQDLNLTLNWFEELKRLVPIEQ